MEKNYLQAVSMLEIASQHAYCAEYLLAQNAEVSFDESLTIDALLPVSSLIYLAFELTFKAFLLQDKRHIKNQYNLADLIDCNSYVGFSKQDLFIINQLIKLQSFRKGIDFHPWENRQEFHVFCEKALEIFASLNKIIPVELQKDYNFS